MPFGNEHLGKAVALLREMADLSQKELASRVDVQPNTMSQYESGRSGMSEKMIFKIAEECKRDPVEIWDMAYSIFRFNHLRERAEKEDLSVEELVARLRIPPSLEAVLKFFDSLAKLFDSLAANVPQLVAGAQESGGHALMKVIVKSRPSKSSKTQKAVGFSGRKKPPRSSKPR
jgi:transcriptional regulator with XRE-family HTH domain